MIKTRMMTAEELGRMGKLTDLREVAQAAERLYAAHESNFGPPNECRDAGSLLAASTGLQLLEARDAARARYHEALDVFRAQPTDLYPTESKTMIVVDDEGETVP